MQQGITSAIASIHNHANAVFKMGKNGRNRLATNTEEVKSAQPVKIPGLTLVNPKQDDDAFVGQALLDALDALEERSINCKTSVANRKSNRNTESLTKSRKPKARKAARSRPNAVKGTVGDGQVHHPSATTWHNECKEHGGVGLSDMNQPAPAHPSFQMPEVATGSADYIQPSQQNTLPNGKSSTEMAFQFQSTWASVQPLTLRNQLMQTNTSTQGWNGRQRQNWEAQQTNRQPALYGTYVMQSYGVPMYGAQQQFPQASTPDNFLGMANSNGVSGSRWANGHLFTRTVFTEPEEGQRYNLRGRKSPRDPPTPMPTEAYLLQSSTAPQQLGGTIPQKLLVILDLNGVLLFRPRKKSPKNFTPRAHLKEFLGYLFANHEVMIWSSARPENVAAMCQGIFTRTQRAKLVAEWARDKLRLTDDQYDNKVQVYKQLSWIWEDPSLREEATRLRPGQGKWDQSNTVLLDDTALKAAAEPYNLIEVPQFGHDGDNYKDGVLSQVVGYLEELKYAGNASYFMRTNPFAVDAGWNFVWPN